MSVAVSQGSGTLAFKGAQTVSLIVFHASTRERWSLDFITKSSKAHVRRRLPGSELIPLAEGKVVDAQLQAHVFAKGLAFIVTVVTGSNGSYKE